MVSRSDVRFKRNIGGSCCEDCLETACCPCCVLVQEEKEEISRLTQHGEPQYQSEQQQMVYGQPQQRPAPPEHHMSERMKIAMAGDVTKLADTAMNNYN